MEDEICVKKKFFDLKSAHASLKKIHSLSVRRRFSPIRAYQCEICSTGSRPIYHLTHHQRSHWLINMDYRIPGKPADPDIIKKRIEELTKIIEIKKEQEQNGSRGNMEGGAGNRRNVRGEQSWEHKKRRRW